MGGEAGTAAVGCGARVLGVLLVILLSFQAIAWLAYTVAVIPENPGYDHNLIAGPLTGPFFGPSYDDWGGFASRARDVSEKIGLAMAVLDVAMVFGVLGRAAGDRSRSFLAGMAANGLLFAWSAVLVPFGFVYAVALLFTGLALALGWALVRAVPWDAAPTAPTAPTAPIESASPPATDPGTAKAPS